RYTTPPPFHRGLQWNNADAVVISDQVRSNPKVQETQERGV
ncbi:hypothetical protein L195_g031347, partial [Trifolium pratense]